MDFDRLDIRVYLFLLIVAATSLPLNAAESCKVIRGRAHVYCGDGQLRIWQIGTHHEYEPDETSASRVKEWLEDGVKESDRSRYACPAGQVYLFADFLVCPTEPFENGSVQHAVVKRADRRRYARAD